MGFATGAGCRKGTSFAYGAALGGERRSDSNSYPRNSHHYFLISSFFGSGGGLAGVADGLVLSDFAVSGLAAGALAAEGGVAGAVAGGGVIIAGFGGSLAFSGFFSHAATSAAAISAIK